MLLQWIMVAFQGHTSNHSWYTEKKAGPHHAMEFGLLPNIGLSVIWITLEQIWQASTVILGIAAHLT